MSQPLQWKLFIRKRASATQGVPPGKDDLKWVANTTTVIHGEQKALLVEYGREHRDNLVLEVTAGNRVPKGSAG